jgi:hypothetical protein
MTMNMKTPLKYTTSLVCLLISIGCVSQSPETGGKTNWLSRCDEAADCDGLTAAVCAEHICTQRCESAESCVVVGEDLACLTSDDDNTRVCTACAGENCASLDAGETTQSDEPTVEQGSEPSLADTTPEAGAAQSSSDDSVVDSLSLIHI